MTDTWGSRSMNICVYVILTPLLRDRVRFNGYRWLVADDVERSERARKKVVFDIVFIDSLIATSFCSLSPRIGMEVERK